MTHKYDGDNVIIILCTYRGERDAMRLHCASRRISSWPVRCNNIMIMHARRIGNVPNAETLIIIQHNIMHGFRRVSDVGIF